MTLYYELEIISHTDKICYLRVQDAFDGKHSLAAYIQHSMRNLQAPWGKEEYYYKDLERWLSLSDSIEQRIHAVIDAPNIETARAALKRYKPHYKKHMKEMGYEYVI